MFRIENPYLEEFLANSRKARDGIASNPGLIERITEKVKIKDCHREFYIPNSWDKEVYMPIEPGKFGMKKRKDIENMKIEATFTADIYHPALPMSPFVVILGERSVSDYIYIVKDFGELQHKQIKTPDTNFPEIVRYLTRKGYISEEWENIFDIDMGGNLVMVDLNCGNMDYYNLLEILEGVNEGKGRFARLSKVWDTLSSSEYKIDL